MNTEEITRVIDLLYSDDISEEELEFLREEISAAMHYKATQTNQDGQIAPPRVHNVINEMVLYCLMRRGEGPDRKVISPAEFLYYMRVDGLSINDVLRLTQHDMPAD